MQRYIIGNAEGQQATVLLPHHTQHMWWESYAAVSRRTLTRIRHRLGDGPYTNPRGNFGQAQCVHLTTTGAASR